MDAVGNTDYRCLSGRIMQEFLAPELIRDLFNSPGSEVVFGRAQFGKLRPIIPGEGAQPFEFTHPLCEVGRAGVIIPIFLGRIPRSDLPKDTQSVSSSHYICLTPV